MVFQVEVFGGIKKGHIKWDANGSFHLKIDTANVASKSECNMILLIFVCKLEIF